MRRDYALIPLYLWLSASVLIHVASYFGTTEVAALWRRHHPAVAAASSTTGSDGASEVEFTYFPPPPDPAATVPPPAMPTATPPERTPASRSAHVAHVVAPSTPVPPPPQPTPTAAPLAPTPPPVHQPHLQAVDQQRTDDQHAPSDPAFIAQSNNDVREQTQAAIRNRNHDNPDPQAGGTPQHAPPQATQGNGQHDVSADDRNVDGSRRVIPSESRHVDDHPAHAMAAPPSTRQGGPAHAGASGSDAAHAQAGRAGSAGAAGAPGAAQTAPTPSGTDGNVITAYAGNSSISLGQSARAAVVAAEGGANGHNGQGGQGGQSGDAASRVGVRGLGAAGAMLALGPNVRQYDAVYSDTVREERVVAQQRRSQARGNYTDSWRENRASIENYIPAVRVGNQTSLRTAHSPFAGYITAMHQRIHRLFAEGFIGDLGNLPPNSPLNNRNLGVTLEIVLERDGRIARLGVVRTSGSTPFDIGALNAVRHSAPYGTAPANILSGDGRVYLHWGFFRDERYCSPISADPFILPNPAGPSAPSEPGPRQGPPSTEEHPVSASPRPPHALTPVARDGAVGTPRAGRPAPA